MSARDDSDPAGNLIGENMHSESSVDAFQRAGCDDLFRAGRRDLFGMLEEELDMKLYVHIQVMFQLYNLRLQ